MAELKFTENNFREEDLLRQSCKAGHWCKAENGTGGHAAMSIMKKIIKNVRIKFI